MITEKKKLPPMLARLKKKGKLKLKKEDIEKYATKAEKLALKEDFADEHGISDESNEGVDEVNFGDDIEGADEEIEEPEEVDESAENDLLVNLISTADDGVLGALLAIIQEELTSRGGDVDVSADLSEDEE